jgi:hypothetical protein
MSDRARSLFDPSRIRVVESFRRAVAESFPTEKGVWTPFLESVHEHLVDFMGRKGASLQLEAILDSVREREVDLEEPDPYCARLRAHLKDQVVLFLCMNEGMGGEEAMRLLEARCSEAVRAWEHSPLS